jgi:hypothetical protein
MALPYALPIGFFLLLGIPCLFFPRWMQRFVLAANARLGHVEPPSGFRRTPQYLRRLRFVGAQLVLGALLLAYVDEITRAPAGIDVAFWTAILAILVVGMFDSTRRLVLYGPRWKEVLVLSGCAASGIGLGAFSYWLHLESAQLADFQKTAYVDLPSDWASDQAPEAREKGSRSYASTAFLLQGALLKHVDRTGQWVIFQPSQAQIKERESRVAAKVRLEDQSTSFARIAWAWWVGSLLAIALGLREGLLSRWVTGDPADPDARRNGARGSP